MIPFTRLASSLEIPYRLASLARSFLSRALLCSASILLVPVLSRAQTGTALVQHAPSVNGAIQGSVQQMTGESVTLNGGANITGDLLVPGTPPVQLNGTPTYSGTLQGSGSASPTNYTITLNTGSSLRNVIRRTNPTALPTVATVPTPAGTTSVTVSTAGQSITWSGLKNLTLNSNVGQVTVPAGTYGNFIAGSGSGFKLGVAGATQASVYNFQNLTLNGSSSLQVLGPVIINLANGFAANSTVGAASNPAWLTLNIKSGGFTLNSVCNLYGYLLAPNGTVIINAGTQLVGGVTSSYLTVNGNGLLKLQTPQSSNQPPVVSLTAPANNSTYTAPASFTLTASASDPNGTVTKVEFYKGTTKLGEDLTAPYSLPLTGVTAGTYSYFARATDNSGATTDSAAISVVVNNPNQPPTVSLTAPTDGTTFTAPATITVKATAADSDGSIGRIDFYQGSIMIGQDTSSPYQVITSTLAAGVYVFSAKSYDNAGAFTTSGTVTVTVVNPNLPPTATITAPADGTSYDDPASFTVTATASDPDGTVNKVGLYRNGVLMSEDLTAPFSFAVSALPIGTYDFIARATDNLGFSTDSAPVNITVAHINDAPTATAQSQTTPEETPLTIILAGIDPDGDPLTYAPTSQPANGTLAPTASPSVFTYTPNSNYNGPDSFTFKVNDGALNSTPATVSLTVTPVNDAPVSYPASVTLNENTSAAFVLAASDVDSLSLAFSIISGPSNGSYTGTLPNVTYTPNANYSGPDSLVFRAFDGQAYSASATVNITVVHVNQPPSVGLTVPANNALFTAPASFTIIATASDSDGTVTKVEFFQGSTKLGESTAAPYQFALSSLAAGSYSFTAKATDNSGATSTTAVTNVLVNAPPAVSLTAPTAGAVFAAPAAITLQATASDTDGTVTKVEFFNGATKLGESAIDPYQYLWTNVASGTYTLTAKATDNRDASTVSSSVTVTVNAPPVANAQNVTTAEDTPLVITLTGTDLEGSLLTFKDITSPANGTLTPTATPSVFTYTPNLNYNGTDSFTFKINDGIFDSVPATVSLAVTPVNDAPVSYPASVALNENTSASFTLIATDVDSASLTFAYNQPVHGTLSGIVPNLTYTPTTNYFGPDTFTFNANDGVVDSNPAIVSIDVIKVNYPPVAIPQSVTTPQNAALAITLTGTDINNSPLSFVVTAQPSNGSLTGTAPNLVYTPVSGFSGSDNFSFTVSNGAADSPPAQVVIQVQPQLPPQITLLTPLGGSAFTVGQSVAFSSEASDPNPNGTVVKVEYFIDGSKVGESSAAPYAFTWTAANEGTHTVLAVATNNYGLKGYSEPGSGSAQILSGLRWLMPVISQYNATDGTCVNPAPVSRNLSGDPETIYNLSLRFRGLVERKTYLGGTNDGAYWQVGGTPDSIAYNIYKLTVSNPAQVFYLNRGTSGSNELYPIDYTAAIQANGNATITLTADCLDGAEHVNWRGLVVPGLTGINQPYNGQFVQMDVVQDLTINVRTITVQDPPTIAPPHITSVPVTLVRLPYGRTNENTASFTPFDLTPTDLGSGRGDLFTVLPTTNPALFRMAGSDVRKINFDTTPANVAIPSGSALTDEYSSIGILMNGIRVSNGIYGGPASAPNATTSPFTPGLRLEFTFTVPVVAVGVINTSPDQNLLEYYAPDGRRLFQTRDQDNQPGPNYNVDRFVGARVNDGNLIGKIVLVNTTGQIELDEMIFEVLSEQTLPGQFSYQVVASDPQSLPITYSLLTAPAGMVINSITGLIKWLPTAADLGDFPVVVRATNSAGYYDTQSFIVHVTANHPPVANNGSFNVPKNGTISLSLTGSDPDGDSLVFSLVQLPAHGLVSLVGNQVTYAPAAGYSGPDGFTFKVNDGFVDSVLGAVSITVINGPPIANTQNVLTAEESPLPIILTGTDVENDPLNYTILAQPQHGTLSGSAPNLTYTPASNYSGPDTFTFKVNDGVVDSTPATVLINVTPVNDRPIANSDSVTMINGVPTPLTLTGSDVETSAGSLVYTVVTPPAHGTLTGTAPNLAYTAAANYIGSDSFTFTVSDGEGFTSTLATVSISVHAPNHAPRITSFPITRHLLRRTYEADENGDVSTWTPLTFDGVEQTPVWTIHPDKRGATEETNSNGTALISDIYLQDSAIDGYFSVGTASDDDYVGFIFGYQDASHFYVFDWKQADQGPGLVGMSVKVVNANSPVFEAELDTTAGDGNRVRTLYHNSISYEDFAEYRFHLTHRSGDIQIVISKGSVVVASIALADSTYRAGRFGFYCLSQEKSHFRELTYFKLLSGDYVYPVKAEDEDGDVVSFALLHGPVGMTVDAATGLLRWPTNSVVAGTYPVSVKAYDPLGGLTVQDYELQVETENLPPIVFAGTDSMIRNLGDPLALQGQVIDDGLPAGGSVTTQWRQIDGPGTLAFSTPQAATTSVTATAPGTYLVELKADDGAKQATDLAEVRIAVATVEPPSGLVAWWTANGHPRESVRGNHDLGFFRGTDFGPGKVSQGLKFDGIDDYAQVTNYSDMDIGASAAGFTIELWVNPTVVTYGPLLHWHNGTADGLHLWTNNGDNRIAAYLMGPGVFGSNVISAVGAIEPGVWQHVALTYDKSTGTLRIYKNGVIMGSANIGTNYRAQTDYNLYLGKNPINSQAFNGSLDEISLYNRPLREEEIRAIFDAGVDGKSLPDDHVPPVVNAGPDIVLSAPGAKALNGYVISDNKPFGSPVITWSQVDGPGTVGFTNAALASTTATFPAVGTYVLKLTASDGFTAPVSDLMEIRVAAPTVSRPTGLAVWWPGNGHVREVIHGDHDVNLLRGASFGPGKISQGFRFDGIDDIGVVQAHPDFDIGSSADGFSIELWVNPNVITYGPMLHWHNGTTDGLHFWTNNDRVAAYLIGPGGGYIDAPGSLVQGVWQHVVLTYDKATGFAMIYRNGTVLGSQNIGTAYRARTDYDLYFGKNPKDPNAFNGTLDEVSLYNRPLSGAEVTGLYNTSMGGKIPLVINSAPVISAGPDRQAYLGTPLQLSGGAVDDGEPASPGFLTYQWSKISGPGSVVFSADTDPDTTATFSAVGPYTLRLAASDSALTGTDDVTVTVSPAVPLVALTAPVNNATILANAAFSLAATATYTNGVVTKVEFFDGFTKLGESTVPDTTGGSLYSFAVAAGLPAGTHSLTAKATSLDGATGLSAPVVITAFVYSGPTEIKLIDPADDTRISAPVTVTGIVAHSSLGSWALERRMKVGEGAPVEPWTQFAAGDNFVGTPANGTTVESPGVLGTFDPTSLLNGIYEVRLVVSTATSLISTTPRTVIVEGNMKVGAFSLAFEDLKVPVAGIPISIVRTYDSRDTRIGDFGPGWRIAVNNVRVQKNRHLGLGWYQTEPPFNIPPFFPFYVEPVVERIVTVTMPDGESHRFRAGAYVKNPTRIGDPDNVSTQVPATNGKLRFYALGDTTSTLEPLDSANQLFDKIYLLGVGNQDLYAGEYGDFDDFPIEYNASRFRLTTKDGTKYIVDEKLGLLKLEDLNGNTLVLNRDGQDRVTSIVSTLNAQPSALSSTITIHRDAAGRVDYIRDLAGNDLDYLYDTSGRLASFTNRESDVTQFRYENLNFPYYLTKIIDPRGVTALRSEFDENGKLFKQIDADGKETVFSRGIDATGRYEKIKDRLGHESTFYYDDRGNVTTKIDPLGAITSFSYYPDSDWVKFETDHYGNTKSMAYDSRGNVTVQTIGAGLTEDPANPTTGYTTRTVYNDRSAPTLITDPAGRVQKFTYGAATGNLLSNTVGFGGTAPATTTYGYNLDGTLDTITDSLGNVTGHTYDYAFSNIAYPGATKQTTVTITDPAGAAGSDPTNATDTVLRSTKTLYDSQDNMLATIATRTLPAGGTEDIVTHYIYDSENRLTATIMPDGKVSETRYTSFGQTDKNLLWKSVADYTSQDDSRARITSYGYDNRGNQTSTTYPDGTSESSSLDLENRREWSQDRLGRRTYFKYDDVGRLRFTIQPDNTPADLTDNPYTETVYDLTGRVTDTYDELRHRTTVTYYDDGTPDAGRRKESILATGYSLLTTSYSYDATGAVRFVTDPRGNTIETIYDDQGRPTTVKYPATDEHPVTQSSTKYDILGRRVETTDQEGKVARYRYDALGRLVEVRQYIDQAAAPLDSGFGLSTLDSRLASTRYSFDELGHQTSQTDARDNTTQYRYDSLGRRTSRILPDTSTETLQYDEWGNLWKRTDFKGYTTIFGYDVLNRLKTRTADPTHPSLIYSHAIAKVEYDYDAAGARTAARTYNAASVTPLYTESTPRDERGRLDSKTNALGTLEYDYYANGLLKDVVSSNTGGLNIGYRYDEANRLAYVDDASQLSALNPQLSTTSYTYNANGSLETVTTPNDIIHTYVYDSLNRLRLLEVGRTVPGEPPFRSYTYALNPSGHRKKITENTGRTADYLYDGLYRLTSETVAGVADPGQNGVIGYTLDKVGNRFDRTSQLSTLSSQLGNTFNSRDWLSGDTFDLNGNTTLSLGITLPDVYDFEDRLVIRHKPDGTSINFAYDADGLLRSKTVLDIGLSPLRTTQRLIDTNNLTGYAQVVEEYQITSTGTTATVYAYGSDLISVGRTVSGEPSATIHYFTYDGLASVRALTDTTGNITDTWDYDAFGNTVARTGTTENAYLYRGEQYDADLGMYYLRARFYNQNTGRFWNQDSYEGSSGDPASLHKYLYANGSPLMFSDPSGNFSLVEIGISLAVSSTLYMMAIPHIEGAVGNAFASLGFVPNGRISISSLGLYDEADLLMEDFGITDADFSENLFAQASIRLTSDAIAGGFSALGGKYLLGAFAKAKGARGGLQDFSYELTQSRSNLAKNLGGTGGQAHHIIPYEMGNNPFIKKAAQGGFRMNGPKNGIRLPLDVHNGSHPEYSTNVRMTLELLGEAFPDATAGEAAALVDQYLTTLRSDIRLLMLSSTKLK